MLWNHGLKNLKLTIKWFFTCPPSPQVSVLLYRSKNIKNSYILYSYVLKFTWIHIMFILMFLNVENLSLSASWENAFLNIWWIIYEVIFPIKLLYTICRRSLHSRTAFKNLKNQSQCFMTRFRNFKNQSAFYNHHASWISIK